LLQATFTRFLRAAAIAFWIATGTSRALPNPKPTRPPVTDHGERGEAELAATLDHLGGAIHRNELLGELVAG
jgi:hypothetical protein